LIASHPETDPDTGVSEEARRVLGVLTAELPPSQAAKLAAAITGAKRKQLYELIAEPVEKFDKNQ
ncbi:MAG: hypothetical protein E2O56_02700, partial [Gammaproteobacteria bacterium]